VITVCVPDSAGRDLLTDLPQGIEVLAWTGQGAPPEGIDRVTFLVARYGYAPMGRDALAAMPRLEVIQLLSAGVEPWLPLVPDGVVLCNGRGVHGGSTAELAVAGISSTLRELPRFFDDQRNGVWEPEYTDGLDGKRVLVVGAGDIGRRVGTAVSAFGATVTFVARTPREDVQPIDDLPGLLPHHDIVVIAVPHTDQTHHLVNESFLAAMHDGALLVNVARGAVVDTDALLGELTRRRLHAFLDVTDPEPLPEGHPLWAAPNLLLTPHIGGGTHGWRQRAYALVDEQIRRYAVGEPLANVVSAGY
jgi:phosphoglycerate dehydrogenase-like enzyme